MPLFEFRCADCGTKFEFLTSSDQHAPSKCPNCSGTKLNKELSAFAVGTSGSGSAESRCDSCPTGSCPYARKT